MEIGNEAKADPTRVPALFLRIRLNFGCFFVRSVIRVEVLGKRTVTQRFLGQIIPTPDGIGVGPKEENAGHVHEMFGDCCGIRVLSSVAARNELEAKGFKGERCSSFRLEKIGKPTENFAEMWFRLFGSAGGNREIAQ